ncbi:MAG: hypothetical protein ACE5H4_12270 [Candidatus Thorarchaeota archaeon]
MKVPTRPIRKRIGLFKNVQQVVAYRLILDSEFRQKVLINHSEINEKALAEYNYRLLPAEKTSLENVLKVVGAKLDDIKVSELKDAYFDEFNEAIDYFVRDFGPEDAGYR